MLAGKRILLIVSGSVAAYKALELARLLGKAGAEVSGLLTAGGARFVTPHALQAITGRPLAHDLWSLVEEGEGRGHIGLARAHDLLAVVPASADRLARMAAGFSDDLAGATLLAATAPVVAAPAMNWAMWAHPATVANVATLLNRGVRLVGPAEGAMAEAESGVGRMAEPSAILAAIASVLADPLAGEGDAALEASLDAALAATEDPPGVGSEGEPGSRLVRPDEGTSDARDRTFPAPLAGRHALVTSGPTQEPIDPVRFLANRSSGRQGHAIAAALAALGARVTLVSGPVSVPDPPGVSVRRIGSAREMLAACEAALPADVAVCAAAVADWRPAEAATAKLKKREGAEPPSLRMVANPDILATLSRHARRPTLVVGFAAETEALEENARAKLARKGCDWVVANDVSGDVMGGAHNAVLLVSPQGVEAWPRLPKTEVARRLAARVSAALSDRPAEAP